ncbi:T9SS type A sorting domain-containing protein [Flavobacterium psychrotrophum]|uniref:Ig-like domain-containing protein n=1 Tax=Flavobacterium psychrotrophum TaxID=2294119 RepID=UPI000E30DCCF|nr:T9SS type A sorting domain-containing protein [Flavobacterium psychrotrophum]
MKKLLLTALMAVSALGAFAQSKTTGVVTLSSGYTAKLDLNSGTSTATLTLAGPSDRWFALQFGSFATGGGMMDGTDVVYFNGTTLVDATQNGIGAMPSTDTNDWTVTSNTTSGSTRTLVATRSFAGGANDYVFNYADANIDFAWARGSSASFSIANHGGNRGYQLNKAFNCLAPDAPAAQPQAFCGGATVANLTATGSSLNWYSAATGGSALAATTALTSATYYVSQSAGACESTRTPVAVTVTTVNAPTAASQSFCNSGTVANLTATGANGATISWYTAATGGTALADTAALASGTYYAEQTVGSCSSTRAAVTVTVTTVAAPTIPEQTFCAGVTVSAIWTNTGNIKWYSTIGGAELAGTTPLATGTYYATHTLNGCESAATPVPVTITTTASVTGSQTQDFTEGQTIADLTVGVIAGAAVSWYTLVGTEYTGVPDTTPLVDGTTYYVTQVFNNCESAYYGITVNATAGIENFSLKGLKAYPNPVSSVVTLSANSSLSNITINNMLGQQVLTQKVAGTSAEVNMAQLPVGTYLIKASADNGATATVRIVKQ